MLTLLRKIWRITLTLLWCIFGLVWMLLTAHGPRKRVEAYVLKWTRIWSRGLARITGLQVVRHGETADFTGGLVVSNHTSYLDVLAHGSLFLLKFAPKAEMRYWPLLGWVTAQSRPIWIDRSSPLKAKASEERMVQAIRDGAAMIVYAEGTTTDGKSGLLPFKSTAFQAAIAAECPVLPVLTFYHPEPEGPGPVEWFGDAAFLPHVWQVLGRKRITADVYVFPPLLPQPGEDRKALAVRVREFMDQEYWRLVNAQK